jgi:flagellar protein FlgJ
MKIWNPSPANEVQATPSAALSPEKKAKLAKAATEFEASMLEEMLKPLGFGAAIDAEADVGGAAATVRDMGTEALSKALAQAGGFGVAQQITKKVTNEHEALDRKAGGTKVV